MSDRKFLIYKFTSPSGKSYIGQTNDLKRRNRHHAHPNNKSCPMLNGAIQKYGFENFTQEILKENLTIDESNYWEEILITEHKTLSPNGYNMATGGLNSKPSEETKAKIAKIQQSPEHKEKVSKAVKAALSNPETRAKMSESHKGMKHTAESKAKIGFASKKNGFSENAREKSRIANTGKVHTEETRAKMSASGKGRVFTQEHKDKIAEANRRRTPELKAEIRAAIKKSMTPEVLAKVSATHKGKTIPPEMRARISETLKNKPPFSPEKRAEINEKRRLNRLAKQEAKLMKKLEISTNALHNQSTNLCR